MPLRAARVGRVGVIGHPVANAVVAKAVSPGPSPVGKEPQWWPRPSHRAARAACAAAALTGAAVPAARIAESAAWP